MYERNYVKKRKRKIWVAIGTGISSIVVAVLCIVSFLGRFVGTFTVNLDTGDVKLALFGSKEDSDQEINPSSYMRVSELPSFHEITYSRFNNIHDLVDTAKSDYLVGAVRVVDKEGKEKIDSLNYFKYTFYVKNYGEIPASYRMRVNIIDSKPSTDGRYLDDTMRVMIYENSSESEHKIQNVYAKRSQTQRQTDPITGETTFKEAISVPEYEATESNPFYGYAEEFESNEVITTILVNNFEVGESRRYTVVMWLEGEDPQSNNYKKAPVGAKIKLGVEINAYEN